MHTLPIDRLETVRAWGLASGAMNYVFRPSTEADLRRAFDQARAAGKTVGLRGAGRSYGDAAYNAEQLLIDLSRMNRILEWDPSAGVIRVEPGVTIAQLWRYAIEDGWWPPVVPGTMFPTIGGCLAMNIHGKNNWQAGPFGEHVLGFTALLPNGEIMRCTPEGAPELFHAFVGGLGLLGCFTSVTLKLKRLYSGRVNVKALYTPHIEAMLERIDALKEEADYVVGWTDGTVGGKALGRGQIHTARYLAPGEDPEPFRSLRAEEQDLPDTLFGVVPKSAMWRFMKPFMNNFGVRAVNAAKAWSSRFADGHEFEQTLAEFNFLLDYIPGWRKAYLPGGLIQHQSFLPNREAAPTFRRILATLRDAGHPPYLGVVKRHRPDPFLLTHSLDGFSLALDFKVTARSRARLVGLLKNVDDLVLQAGGRFYFAKDSLLRPEIVRGFLGQETLERFYALKLRCDPDGLLETNLSRRAFPELGRQWSPLEAEVAGERASP